MVVISSLAIIITYLAYQNPYIHFSSFHFHCRFLAAVVVLVLLS